MKSIIKVFVLTLSLSMCAVILPQQASAQQSNVSFQMFYDQLSPYGQWIDYPNYGYVWVPDVGADFVPYSTDGHWVSTEYGWTWVSDYDWGWAPFHYGRWDFDNNYGWFWEPGTEWGPAWVSWRSSNGYYGWEPMGYGMSIGLSFGRPYNDHWTYVRYGDFDRPNVNRYAVNRTYNSWLFKNSSPIRNTYSDRGRNSTYVSGPKRADVQKNMGRKVSPVSIRDNSRPGQNYSKGQLGIYRPKVTKGNTGGQKTVPTRITSLKDVKRPSERNAKSAQQQNARQQQQNTKATQQKQQQQQQNARQQQQNTKATQQKQQQQQQSARQQQQNTKATQQKQQQQQQNARQQQQNTKATQQKQQQQQQNARQQQQNTKATQQRQQQQQQQARQQQQNARSNQQQQQARQQQQQQVRQQQVRPQQQQARPQQQQARPQQQQARPQQQ